MSGLEEASVAAMASFPGIGPGALLALLHNRTPLEAWALLARSGNGHVGLEGAKGWHKHLSAWSRLARRSDLALVQRRLVHLGVRCTWLGAADYPSVLAGDPQPPPALFWRGDLGLLSAQCVALVGTRRPTPSGLSAAFELGRDLAACGVVVVSGLAVGIDGAAHRGALAGAGGATVGVAASGLDLPYPKRHAGLWEEVGRRGVLISEAAPGTPAQAWRFPVRNRIIAALSQILVVVESHAKGGSLLSVEAALARGRDVRAVPGPVQSPASAGTNALIYDGAGIVRHAGDILDALGRLEARPSPDPEKARGHRALSTGGQRPEVAGLSPRARRVLAAMGYRPQSLNQVVCRAGLGVDQVVVALEELLGAGWVDLEAGWWTRLR